MWMSSYFQQALEPATSKPRISSISLQHGALIFILCLLALELGIYWATPSLKSSGMRLNLIIAAGLLMNYLAYAFQWSRLTTMLLRVTAWGWLLLMVDALFFWR
jgi:hypothetical protein